MDKNEGMQQQAVEQLQHPCRYCEWATHMGGSIWYCPFVKGSCAKARATEVTKGGQMEDTANG